MSRYRFDYHLIGKKGTIVNFNEKEIDGDYLSALITTTIFDFKYNKKDEPVYLSMEVEKIWEVKL